MQPLPAFNFQATAVFGLFGRGIVFRGKVTQGQIRVGQMVKVVGKTRTHSARVAAIELDRKLIESSIHGSELGLLLNDFDDPQVNRILAPGADFEAAPDMPPSPEALLSIELPVDISEYGLTSRLSVDAELRR